MYHSLSYKSKQFFWLIIKLSTVIGCGYFIWKRLLFTKELDFFDLYQNLIEENVFSLKNSLYVLCFSFFNWFFEILKWKTLVSFCKKISLLEAAKQSVASLVVSLITPNRVGEYGAKALYYDKKTRKQILGLNLIGNFYQMLATVFFGIIGFAFFIAKFHVEIDVMESLKIILWILSLGSICFFLLYKLQNKFLKRIRNFINKIPFSLNLKIGILSFVRFVIFSHQFYFLLILFKVNLSYIDAISAITSVYFIASVIPMLSMFDFVLKGSVAVWVFSYLKITPFTIVSITTIMWILNFAIPAIIGSYFVVTFKPKLIR